MFMMNCNTIINNTTFLKQQELKYYYDIHR